LILLFKSPNSLTLPAGNNGFKIEVSRLFRTKTDKIKIYEENYRDDAENFKFGENLLQYCITRITICNG
jgi:hypothetical protein